MAAPQPTPATKDIRATMRALETGDRNRFCAGLTPRLAAGWLHHIALIADDPDLASCPDTVDTDAVADLDDDLLANLRSYQLRIVIRGHRRTAYSTVPGEPGVATPILRRDGRWLIDTT